MVFVVGFATLKYGDRAAHGVSALGTNQMGYFWITQTVVRGKGNRGDKTLGESLRQRAERTQLLEED
jgi:hypothetical protein